MTFEQLAVKLEKGDLWNKVLVGIGPMSKNTVDAVIEIVNALKFPIQLIASRRQIECKALGGGYVNNWCTEDFARYVRERDTHGNILLCRDHGGPWQGEQESNLSHERAIENACISYEADIRAGFDIIHLDPSLQSRPLAHIKKDVERLLDFCEGIAGSKNINYECGTEETNGRTTDIKDFEGFVKFCKDLSPKIKFCVGQTGTLVKERRNVGKYDASKARQLVKVCEDHGLFLKEHNLDYASAQVLKDHVLAGIHSVNLAPEFGTLETDTLLQCMMAKKHDADVRRFTDLANKSLKWQKWAISDLDDESKALISGHYIFTHPEVEEMKHRLADKIPIDHILKAELHICMIRYLRSFGWLV